MERDHRRPFGALLTLAIACLVAAPSVATTTTPSSTPTRTATCGSTATPYCADQCLPCPTIRAGCYAVTCGECHENPVCGPGEACAPEGLGGCCACATFTPTTTGPTPEFTRTLPPTPVQSPTPVAICDGDCNADGAVSVDELIAAVRVALGENPTGGCVSFDRDGDGMVSIDELVALVRNALIGCTEIDLSGVDGVYDAQAASTQGVNGPGLAVVARRGRDLRVDADLGIGESLGFDARQGALGGFDLEGGGITSGDIAYHVQGHGALMRGTEGSRFVATLNYVHAPETGGLILLLERPAAGTPAAFTGTYRLHLQHAGGAVQPFTSSIEMSVAVDQSGLATCAATRDVRDDDTVLAELAAADCLLSPAGRFAYRSPYDTGNDFIEPLLLSGVLVDESGNGSGFFSLGYPPFGSDWGTWNSIVGD